MSLYFRESSAPAQSGIVGLSLTGYPCVLMVNDRGRLKNRVIKKKKVYWLLCSAAKVERGIEREVKGYLSLPVILGYGRGRGYGTGRGLLAVRVSWHRVTARLLKVARENGPDNHRGLALPYRFVKG